MHRSGRPDDYDAPSTGQEGSIVETVARNMVSVARGAATATASGLRHAVWYVRYQLDGTSRAQKAPARRRPPRD
jgi:hypothetical protein